MKSIVVERPPLAVVIVVYSNGYMIFRHVLHAVDARKS